MLEALSGHLDEAEIAARHAIELQERAMSGTEGLLIVGAHARLGYVHYLRGNYDSAYVEYRRGIRDDQRSRAARANADRAAPETQRAAACAWRSGSGDPLRRHGHRSTPRRLASGADDPTRHATTWLRSMLAVVMSIAREHLALPLAGCPSSHGGASNRTEISTRFDRELSFV